MIQMAWCQIITKSKGLACPKSADDTRREKCPVCLELTFEVSCYLQSTLCGKEACCHFHGGSTQGKPQLRWLKILQEKHVFFS